MNSKKRNNTSREIRILEREREKRGAQHFKVETEKRRAADEDVIESGERKR